MTNCARVPTINPERVSVNEIVKSSHCQSSLKPVMRESGEAQESARMLVLRNGVRTKNKQ